jgi:phage terminase large subunit-like protein
MHMAWEAKKHPAKNIMKMGFMYINARQNVTATNMNPDQFLFIICASFEAAKFLIPIAIFGYILIRLNP